MSAQGAAMPEITAELREALRLLLRIDTLELLGAHVHRLHSADEIAVRFEQEALRSQRASEGYVERERYDLAAGERERARELRLRAAALRLVCAAIDECAAP
jgi:hypothetical protein